MLRRGCLPIVRRRLSVKEGLLALSLVKNFSKTGNKCRVTFKLSAVVANQHNAKTVELVGTFNQWGKEGDPIELKRLKDGSFSVTYTLDSGKDYQFRYKINGGGNDGVWENDDAPDKWVKADNGSDNSLVSTNSDGCGVRRGGNAL